MVGIVGGPGPKVATNQELAAPAPAGTKPHVAQSTTPPLQQGGVAFGESLPVSATKTSPAVSLRAESKWFDPAIRQLFPRAEDVPAAFRVVAADNPPVFLIDGKVSTYEGKTEPVTSRVAIRNGGELETPVIGFEAQLTEVEAMQAMASADKAWANGRGAWPKATFAERAKAVSAFADKIEAEAEKIATLLMWEIGKPLGSARKEVLRTVEYIRETIVALDEVLAETGTLESANKGSTTLYARNFLLPIGRVLCVAPFNYPVNEMLTTVIPALLMGNVVVAKTPRYGALAVQAMMPAFAESFPAGVVSVLPGSGRKLMKPMMEAADLDESGKVLRGKIDKLAFIGSKGASDALLSYHPSPSSMQSPLLGLGAKNAAVLTENADLEAAASVIVGGALGYNGQRCTAEKIIFVPREKAKEFTRIFTEKVEAMALGMPWEDGVKFTPLPEEKKLQWMHEYIEDAVAKGAKIQNKGGGQGDHSLMRPAVLFPVDMSMKIAHEEQFGPVVPIVPYDSLEEVYDWHEKSEYGMQAAIWGPTDEVTAVDDELIRFVSQTRWNEKAQRGPDQFAFTAVDGSGQGVLSLKDALYEFSTVRTRVSKDPAELAQLAPALPAKTEGEAP